MRRHYVFAIRGELPIPETGWTVSTHSPTCADPDYECPQTPACPRVRTAFFRAARVPSPAWSSGVTAMSGLVDRIIGVEQGKPFSPAPDVGTRLQVAVAVSAPYDADPQTTPENHFDTCFDLARECGRALQQVTGDLAAPLARQQLLPLYFVVDEDRHGARSASQIKVMEDAYLGSDFAEPGEANAAATHLLAAWLRNPVELYHDMTLGARRALHADGNYVDAVLRSAAACEVLIKHMAWMTTWEAREVTGADRVASDRATETIVDPYVKPRTLISLILAPRLQGNWDSRLVTAPVGAWRHLVAQMRNNVIHLGYRPSEREADAAVAATQQFETFVLDRLATKAATYPRTALLLVGRDGLERRDQFGPARATWNNESIDHLLGAYKSWLDRYHLADEHE